MQDSTEGNTNNPQQPVQPTPTTPVAGPTTPQSDIYADPISQQTPDEGFAASPISANGPASFSPDTPPATPITSGSDGLPFVPDKPEKKSKKKLIIGIAAAVIAVIILGGSSAFAAYYMNPEKAVTDALVDAATTRTQISSGSFLYTNTKNKDKVSLTFASKSDTPNFKGQLDAKLKVDYDKYNFEIAGAGILSESGNAYFKFDGVEKVINKYIEDPQIKAYTDQSPKLKDDLVAFAKKIDGKYIKLSKADMQNIWKEYDHSKAKECYTKVFDDLDKNSAQKKQIYDVYNQNKFVIIKDQGSETINGVDSVKYGIGADMVKYSHASEALQDTTFSQNLQKCQDKLTGQKTEDTDDQQTAEEKKETQKYQDDYAKEQQKEVDKAKVNIWISRWGHQFTKTTASYTNKDSNTSYALDINYKLGQKVSVADPNKSIPMSEFQADIDKIQADYDKTYSSASTDTETVDINTVNTNVSNASRVQVSVEAYYADNGGKYPTIGQLKAVQQGAYKLKPELIAVLGAEAPDASHQDRIQYKVCSDGSGYDIYYWEKSENAVSGLNVGCDDTTT